MEVEGVVDDLLYEGLDDWVPLDTLLWYARQASPGPPIDSFKGVVVAALEAVLFAELMIAGDIGDSGFEGWPSSPAATLERIIVALDDMNWEPLGGLCWLSNTARGRQRALAIANARHGGRA